MAIMVRPLCAVLLSYILGILVSYYWQISLEAIIALGALAVIMGVYRETTGWRKNRVYFLVAVAALAMGLFHWNEVQNKGNISFLAGKQVVLEGVLSGEPDIRPNMVNYTIDIDKAILDDKGMVDEPLKGKILLTVTGKAPKFQFGDILRVRGVPEIPKEAGNPGEFDYRKYLQAKGIQLIMKSWGGAGIERAGTGAANPFVSVCISVKQKLTSVLAQTLSRTHLGLMEGILFGSYGLISPETREDFALTGVVHILSVSGYHVGLLAAACLFIGNSLGLSGKSSSILTVFVTAFYVIMTGANPPVIRAAVMAWVMLFARNTGRRYDWPSAMSLAALLILVVNPHALFNAGFQLSFAATWGILYLSPALQKFISSQQFSPAVSMALKASTVALAAQVAVIPAAAYYFNYLSLISLIANMVIVPLVSLVMLLGVTAVMSGLIWMPMAGAINITVGLILDLVLDLARLFARIPYSVVYIKQPSVMEVLVFYLLLFFAVQILMKPALWLRVKRNIDLYGRQITGIALLAAGLFLWTGAFYPARKMEVTFLDIGQGDATFIETPGGRTILIDTGGASGQQKFQPGEKILLPYLRRNGVRAIDIMVLTHPHADHIQGAEALLGNIKVKMLAVNVQFCQSPDGLHLINAFRAGGTKIHQLTGGEEILLDENISLKAIYPLEPVPSAEGVNNDSLITCISYGDFELLLTGDAEEPALREASGLMGTIDAEVVKVPHHGSKNAWCEEFYRSVGAEQAIISVGRNFFGHPSDEVLEGLEAFGIRVYRTDLNGAVTVRSDGDSYEIATVK